jgi:hypothetical protein
MAQYTKEEIEKLDLIGPYGPFGNVSGNATFTMDGLDLIGPYGPFWAITPTGVITTFDTTRMFLIF